MRRTAATLALTLLSLFGCRGESRTDAAVMTAEEHAMQAGAGVVAESIGATSREPVHLTTEQARAIGVTYTEVARGRLTRPVRTVGQVVPAEPGLAEITTKVDGFVEDLFVNTTGVAVRRGQPLLALYSPMLVAAEEELLTATRLVAVVDTSDTDASRYARQLLTAARRRLVYWDISSEQIERLERTGEVTKLLTLAAPFDGFVLEKMVVAGQAVVPGMKLYRLADLSTVWIEGAVFEKDLAFVRSGVRVRAEFAAYPGRSFDGRVSFVWPTVDEQSRTARVRVTFANRDGVLRPGMYATLAFEALVGSDVLHVPAEAIVMTGERNLVFVVGVEGTLEPREVALGPRAGDRFQVLRGLTAGERIVASANFLVDAESRLTTATGVAGMPGMPDMPGMKPGAEKRRP